MKNILITLGFAIMFIVSGSVFAAPAVLGGHDTHVNSNSNSKSKSRSNAIATTNSASDQQQGQLQGQQQGQLGVAGNNGLGNGIGNDNSRTNIIAAEIPVATALAAPLVTSNDTCMGSSSAGAQSLGFGFSIGSTWSDKDCITRKDARFMANLGAKDLALSLMCAKEDVRMAVARLGTSIQMEICHITADEVAMATTHPVTVSSLHSRVEESDKGEIDMMIDNSE